MHFRSTQSEEGTIRLIWSKLSPEAQNGYILGYHVRLHGSTPRPIVVYNIYGEENTELVVMVNRDHPHKRYAFSIAAYNEAGDGEFSPPLFVQLSDEP